MSMAWLPPTSHVTLLATLRRERALPVPGTVLAETREQVEPATIVARGDVADSHRLIDVARLLGLKPGRADDAMLKRDGEPVRLGEPIAERPRLLGLGKRVVRSPVDGKLVVSGGGRALLAAFTRPYELRAGLPGMVISLVANRGVVIQTTGALLEGVWGNNRQDTAALRVFGDQPDQALSGGDVQMSMRGAILAVPALADPAALRQLDEVRVRGLIVGRLAGALLPALAALEYPVMVVEGFGAGGFSGPAYDLLTGSVGREVWLNAQSLSRHEGRRPEMIVPLPSPSQPPPPPIDGDPLVVGKRVRVLRGPLAGRVGTVTALPGRPELIASGLRTRTAHVALADDGQAPARIPYANLELLE
jgi:hypothetical protein